MAGDVKVAVEASQAAAVERRAARFRKAWEREGAALDEYAALDVGDAALARRLVLLDILRDCRRQVVRLVAAERRAMAKSAISQEVQ